MRGARFHVLPVPAAGSWGLWAVLVEDSNGNWFEWPENRGGEFWSSIFHSRSDAMFHAERSAKNFKGTVVAKPPTDHYSNFVEPAS